MVYQAFPSESLGAVHSTAIYCNAMQWLYVAPCGSCKKPTFQSTVVQFVPKRLTFLFARVYFSILKMETTRSSEISGLQDPYEGTSQKKALFKLAIILMTTWAPINFSRPTIYIEYIYHHILHNKRCESDSEWRTHTYTPAVRQRFTDPGQVCLWSL
jgi:hypothetical protein